MSQNRVRSMEDLKQQLGDEFAEALDQGISNLAVVGSLQKNNAPAIMGKTLPVPEIDAIEENEIAVVVSWVKVKPENAEDAAKKYEKAVDEVFDYE